LDRLNEALWERYATEKINLQGLRPRTVQAYEPAYRRFVAFIGKDVSGVTPDDLARFLGSLSDLKGTTVDWYADVLKSFFRWAVKRHHVTDDPWDGVHRKRSEIPPPKALPWEAVVTDVENMRGRVWSPRDQMLATFLLYTGARVGEVVSLVVSDLDMARARVGLTRTKGREARSVHIPKFLVPRLEAYLRWRGKMVPNATALFPSARGNRLDERMVGLIFDSYGVKWSPHVLRHTYATEALRTTGNLALVQKLLGHQSPATTSRYLKVWDEDKAKAAEMLGSSAGSDVRKRVRPQLSL